MRLSSLLAASLRISESLDLETVLRSVVESTRELTGARSSAIATIDESGRFQNFAASGLSSEEKQRLFEMPRAAEVWNLLHNVPKAVRLDDLAQHLKAQGFPKYGFLATSYLGVPIRHQGIQVGAFCLIDKEGGPLFTIEDEEVLSLLAEQAGAAILNARKYRDEQRARADLEALIDTTPVGVVIFEAKSGKPVYFNEVSRRIIQDLCLTGQTVHSLLEVLRIRRADGREILLDESSLTQALLESTAIRAEEIILEGPNGHQITIVVNAAPLRSEQGTFESMIVTIQDMTPLEELERMRAEFLGMVSHELRSPLASIKGCATTVLEAAQVLDPAETVQFFRVINEQVDNMRAVIGDLLDTSRIETGTLSVTPEPADLASIVDQAKNMFLSAGYTQSVRIDLPLELPRVLADRHRIVQVVSNLLTNAARHSPNSSEIRITAAQKSVYVETSVADQGQGIPVERLPHLFRRYAHSGRENRDRGIGAGLGLAICKGIVEAHGGRIWAESAGAGMGSRFTFTVPTVAQAKSIELFQTEETALRPAQSEPQKLNVLVVDDDPQALVYVRNILADEGFESIATGEPKKVSALIENHQPDLVLLDLLLPGTDGIAMMDDIPGLAELPIIFLSAYGRDETVARALENGAADYIVKPFSPTVLIARIRATLRKQIKSTEHFKARDLCINYEERRVTLASQPVLLTATEYDLLKILSINAGRVLTYGFLLRNVWRLSDSGRTQLVRAFVKKLRHKLGDDAANPVYIFTEWRVGYRMVEPDIH